tara:strand:+ start:144 stop:398 length:255 start_codon:yes stop_codon:yes gene_type:complete
MLILDYPNWEQPTLFEEFLPKALFELTPELAEIDQLIQNPVFEEPIIERYHVNYVLKMYKSFSSLTRINDVHKLRYRMLDGMYH